MDSLVVYDSQFGNTKKLAEAVADGLLVSGRFAFSLSTGYRPRI